MNKSILGAVGVLALLIGGYVLYGNYFVGERVVNDKQDETSILVEGEKVADGTYTADIDSTRIDWEGRKTLIVDYKDTGTLRLASGEVSVSEGLLSGELVFDMESISASSTGRNAGEEMLTKHLKSKDFFDVENHKTATLSFENVSASEEDETLYNVNGLLVIKGISQEVNFPVRVYSLSGDLRADGEVALDRTLWDIQFGSGKFFQNLGDNVIDDMFTVSFSLLAK